MKPVRLRWNGLALALGLALIVTTGAEAATQKPKPKAKPKAASKPWTGAESGLLGIKLYDPGIKVVEVYGTPDQIEALSQGSTTAGAGGGGAPGMGGPGGAPGMGSRGSGAGGGAGAAMPSAGHFSDPFGFGDVDNFQSAPPGKPGRGGPGGGPGSGPPPGMLGPGGGPRGPGGAGGGGGEGGGIPPQGGGAADRVTFTRWVYNREGSKYGFIIDKAGRVIQIEAIGIENGRVKTKRNLGFGATFATVLKTYQQPDGYEIAGDNLMMKYLVHDNVAFRFTRLGAKKPQVVTGIVVAAGKS